MSGQGIEWRSRWPRRAMSNFVWYVAMVVVVMICVWILFGSEPDELNTGAENPVATVPWVITIVAIVGMCAMAVPVVLRPWVAANDDMLLVRTGLGKVHRLPWSRVAEIAIIAIKHENYMFILLHHISQDDSIRLNWLERATFDRIVRYAHSGVGARYDFAVPLRDFGGETLSRLTALAAFAPDDVEFNFSDISG